MKIINETIQEAYSKENKEKKEKEKRKRKKEPIIVKSKLSEKER